MEEVQTANTSKRDIKSILKIVGWLVGAVGFITLVISLISLIVIGAKDYTKGEKYSYSQNFFGVTMSVDLILHNDGTFTQSIKVPGEDIQILEGRYHVAGGKIYVEYSYDEDFIFEEDAGFEEYGKISATKIVVEDPDSEMKATLVCKSVKTPQNVSTAFAIIGGILTVAGAGLVITLYCLGKKKTTDTEEAQV